MAWYSSANSSVPQIPPRPPPRPTSAYPSASSDVRSPTLDGRLYGSPALADHNYQAMAYPQPATSYVWQGTGEASFPTHPVQSIQSIAHNSVSSLMAIAYSTDYLSDSRLVPRYQLAYSSTSVSDRHVVPASNSAFTASSRLSSTAYRWAITHVFFTAKSNP